MRRRVQRAQGLRSALAGAGQAPLALIALCARVQGMQYPERPILPEHINCEGCRVDGIKTVYCDSLCSIRQCALKKGVTTCGDCPELEKCQTVGRIISNNPTALENLKCKPTRK